ncbi:hypothetical protein [Cardinium endosymbiont of Bemisia tabaci]|nr:hypothetical protein [Cardinium endosymbiont of Bemisia tabaci]
MNQVNFMIDFNTLKNMIANKGLYRKDCKFEPKTEEELNQEVDKINSLINKCITCLKELEEKTINDITRTHLDNRTATNSLEMRLNTQAAMTERYKNNILHSRKRISQKTEDYKEELKKMDPLGDE